MKMVADSTISNKSETSSFHESVRDILRICRWAGFFPVDGLESKSIGDLRYNIRAAYGIYHGFSVISSLVVTIITFYLTITSEFSLGMLTTILFVGLVFSIIIILHLLARKWSYLMKRSISFEKELAAIRTNTKVPRNAKIIGNFFLIMGFSERALYYIFTLDFVRLCMGESSITNLVVINAVKTTSPTFFAIFDYNSATAIISEMVSLQSVFILNIIDILLMLVSYYLSSYFQDLNLLIETQKSKISTDWGRIRRYYSKIVCMVNLCDTYFSFIVLMSMGSNLFFICLQLYNTFNLSKDGFEYCKSDETIYEAFHSHLYYLHYSFSFITLVLRAFAMTFLTANVHSKSQEPLYALGEVHSTVYNIEIERFVRQIKYTNIGIGGIFFNVTRQLILKVFATMITYELVMVQFAQTATEMNPLIIDNSSLSLNDSVVFSNDTV